MSEPFDLYQEPAGGTGGIEAESQEKRVRIG
jgi:hypothetical protein